MYASAGKDAIMDASLLLTYLSCAHDDEVSADKRRLINFGVIICRTAKRLKAGARLDPVGFGV